MGAMVYFRTLEAVNLALPPLLACIFSAKPTHTQLKEQLLEYHPALEMNLCLAMQPEQHACDKCCIQCV